MFLGVLDIFKDCFTFAYESLDRIKLIGETSVLDFLLVFFVAGIFVPLFASMFGGRAISTGGSSAIGSIRERENDKARQKENDYRKSYEYYKENRSRNESYSRRYKNGL